MKILKILAIGAAFVMAVVVAGVMAILNMSPETSIYNGSQVPKRFMSKIRDLGLLAEGEKIKYFYSDAILDIRDGMYFVTDRKLVVYCRDWEDPDLAMELGRIAMIDAEYDDSFWTDSYVTVIAEDEEEVSFPLSSENGRDKDFVNYLAGKAGVEVNVDGAEEAADAPAPAAEADPAP